MSMCSRKAAKWSSSGVSSSCSRTTSWCASTAMSYRARPMLPRHPNRLEPPSRRLSRAVSSSALFPYNFVFKRAGRVNLSRFPHLIPHNQELAVSARAPAILVLRDGTVFRGTSIGADGSTVGEVVFNTAMTGYQEILTDPSYCQQIVTLTYPHVGNYGANTEDVESERICAAGLVVRDLPVLASNWRSTVSLPDYLKGENVVAIAGIDTRKLTRLLRDKGAQDGCIMAGRIDEQEAHRAAQSFPGLV